MTVNVLGTEYEIVESTPNDDKQLETALGYTDWTTNRIVLDVSSESVTLGNRDVLTKKVLRHEIVHAFFIESGVHECSGETSCWAANEIMVDWFARQGPKIYAAWQSVGAV